MAFQDKNPSIKINIDKDAFNKLVSILEKNRNLNIEDNNFSVRAKELVDKLLTYSVPKTDEEDEEYVDVRFFPSEAACLIIQLLIFHDKEDANENYYYQLIQNREEYKNKKSIN